MKDASLKTLGQQGFTLVETIVAFSVFTAALAMMLLFLQGIREQQKSEDREMRLQRELLMIKNQLSKDIRRMQLTPDIGAVSSLSVLGTGDDDLFDGDTNANGIADGAELGGDDIGITDVSWVRDIAVLPGPNGLIDTAIDESVVLADRDFIHDRFYTVTDSTVDFNLASYADRLRQLSHLGLGGTNAIGGTFTGVRDYFSGITNYFNRDILSLYTLVDEGESILPARVVYRLVATKLNCDCGEELRSGYHPHYHNKITAEANGPGDKSANKRLAVRNACLELQRIVFIRGQLPKIQVLSRLVRGFNVFYLDAETKRFTEAINGPKHFGYPSTFGDVALFADSACNAGQLRLLDGVQRFEVGDALFVSQYANDANPTDGNNPPVYTLEPTLVNVTEVISAVKEEVVETVGNLRQQTTVSCLTVNPTPAFNVQSLIQLQLAGRYQNGWLSTARETEFANLKAGDQVLIGLPDNRNQRLFSIAAKDNQLGLKFAVDESIPATPAFAAAYLPQGINIELTLSTGFDISAEHAAELAEPNQCVIESQLPDINSEAISNELLLTVPLVFSIHSTTN